MKKLKKRQKRRKAKQQLKTWERAGWLNRHHIKAKARGGKDYSRNIIFLDRNRHEAFHFLFGLMTFKEAGNLLLKAHRIKRRFYGR